ncbi:MAG TPA: LacI family DNA-binding transcriptional regulator [Bacteroidales bacterium]|nr:LacI family DNA-binding transcriptional regulator [Bacteroidales bacterium]
MFSRKARLKDIAALSGVSIGTVDRVLHNRGQVAEKTKETVLKVARELNYTPNIMARALKTRKGFNLVSLLPAPADENAFWLKHPEGIAKAMSELEQFPVNLTQITFNFNSESDFQKKAKDLLKKPPDGIILAPVFRSQSIKFCSELKNKKIPFVFVDNYLTETDFLAYIGEDIYRSGRVAGQLADLLTPADKDILIVNIAKNIRNMHHLNKRVKGFISYFSGSGRKKNKITILNIPDIKSKTVKEMTDKSFSSHPGIRTIFVTGSKSFIMAEYILSEGHAPVNIIGYDLLDKNVEFLKIGIIRFIIGQRPEEQTYRAVKKLFEYLTLNRFPEKMEYLPVDIVTSENVDFFINNI